MVMTGGELRRNYQGYLACLNRKDWSSLGEFVHEAVIHNGRRIGLVGYQEMLESDFRAIPDLRFTAELETVDPPHVACRLVFDCRPVGIVFGLPVNGRRVRFHENVFYKFENARILEVWSIIDQAAVARQLTLPE
jgi:predicted ester cyclase